MKKVVLIVGDNISPVEKKAVENLTELTLDYTIEYPICAKRKNDFPDNGYFKIYMGTKNSNPYIKEISDYEFSFSEEYHIKVKDDTPSTTLKGNIFKGPFHIPRLYIIMALPDEYKDILKYAQ